MQIQSMIDDQQIMKQIFNAGENLKPLTNGSEDPIWQSVFDDYDIIV